MKNHHNKLPDSERAFPILGSTGNLLSACIFLENKKGNYTMETTGVHIGNAQLQDGKFQINQSGQSTF